MRRAVAVALSVCLLVVVLWPALSMCATYLMGPSAAGADAAAARYGNGYSAGHSLGRHAYVRVGESDDAGWGREYYYKGKWSAVRVRWERSRAWSGRWPFALRGTRRTS